MGGFKVAIDPAHRDAFQDPEQRIAISRAAFSFREFLKYWYFVNQDTGQVQLLGESLWEGQEAFVRQCESPDVLLDGVPPRDDPDWWTFFLKARQLGESTIACAYDGWAARFRDLSRFGLPSATNVRVHLYHKREQDAQKLLKQVRFGLERLPAHWRLPVERETTTIYQMQAGFGVEDDLRTIQAYPADNDASRGDTSGHAHIDEWAFMGNPERVWQAIEPSAAGTVHFVTTEIGPATFTANFYRDCIEGKKIDRRKERIKPFFVSALARPDRTAEWVAAKKAEGGEAALREYPTTWQEALSSGGKFYFEGDSVDLAVTDFLTLDGPVDGEKYAIGCDIGRHQDAAVFIVLRCGEDDMFDLVDFQYHHGVNYPTLQQEIVALYRKWNRGRARAVLGIEKNSAGEAVIENCDLPVHVADEAKFTTTNASKARILAQLRMALQAGTLRWNPDTTGQLTDEVRGYQVPDDNIRQDCVMALAIALEYTAKAHAEGTVLGVLRT